MVSTRKPHSFPTLENDENFIGPRDTVKEPWSEPTHLAQKKLPWNELHQKFTLSSSRHEVYHYDPQAPRDSLDFVLKAQYNQHKEFLKGQNETLVQPETIGLPHGRILKNPEGRRKDLIHSIKNAIEGHHTQTTNRGYARKLDGGFFTS
ncbi:hypothetical protein LSAT2_014977 [Lamellibrachia satsuma]|nr:hypothetical protein LSAT2_014977 [Lamellibrachia satsuma]